MDSHVACLLSFKSYILVDLVMIPCDDDDDESGTSNLTFTGDLRDGRFAHTCTDDSFAF